MKAFKIHFMTIWYYSYNTNKQIDLGSLKLNINLIFFFLSGQSIAMPISFSVADCILHPFSDSQAQCLSGPAPPILMLAL